MADTKAIAMFLDSAEAQLILGIPCFRFVHEARLWRYSGAQIPPRAEDEQAYFLGHLLKLASERGPKWNEAFAEECEQRVGTVVGLAFAQCGFDHHRKDQE